MSLVQGVSLYFPNKMVFPPVETVERYADVLLAGGATYTPTDKGLFYPANSGNNLGHYSRPQYYSSALAAWYSAGKKNYEYWSHIGSFIGDGANFRLYNGTGTAYRMVLFRLHLEGTKYERYADVSVPAGGTYTPVAKGLLHECVEADRPLGDGYMYRELYSTAGAIWMRPLTYSEAGGLTESYGNPIGDGANLRYRNVYALALQLVLMRMVRE